MAVGIAELILHEAIKRAGPKVRDSGEVLLREAKEVGSREGIGEVIGAGVMLRRLIGGTKEVEAAEDV